MDCSLHYSNDCAANSGSHINMDEVVIKMLDSQWYRGAYEDSIWLYFSYLNKGEEDKIYRLKIEEYIEYWLRLFAIESKREVEDARLRRIQRRESKTDDTRREAKDGC